VTKFESFIRALSLAALVELLFSSV